MSTFLQDLRYAVRSLFRQPSFAIAAIATLALGIGATTAIFTVVNAVVFRPLPVERPDRLVAILNQSAVTGRTNLTVSAQDFDDWKAQSRSFAVMAHYQGGETSVTLDRGADYATVYRVTPGFFDALGVRTSIGRLLSPAEEQPGGPLSVVITDAFWHQRFNGDAKAIGATIKANDRIFTIVGVLAPGLRFPARADIFAPAWIVPVRSSRGGHNFRVIARLQDGVTIDQARGEILSIARRLEQEYPDTNKDKHATVVPLKDLLVGDTRSTFDMLMWASVVVLLIACANVANLLLARSSVRSREMVVRAAVGAGRWRLIRQLLTESLVLAVVAGLAGAWLARLGVVALIALAPADLPRARRDSRRRAGAVVRAARGAGRQPDLRGRPGAADLASPSLVRTARRGKGHVDRRRRRLGAQHFRGRGDRPGGDAGHRCRRCSPEASPRWRRSIWASSRTGSWC